MIEKDTYPIIGTIPATNHVYLNKISGTSLILSADDIMDESIYQLIFIGTHDECEFFTTACIVKRHINECMIVNWSYLYYKYTKGYICMV